MKDSRTSRKRESGTADIPSGDASNFDPIVLDDEESMSLEELRIDYDDSGGAAVTVEVYDEDDTVGSGAESDLIDKFRLAAGEDRNPDMVYRDVEDGVLVTTDGSHDAVITITAGGYIISG